MASFHSNIHVPDFSTNSALESSSIRPHHVSHLQRLGGALARLRLGRVKELAPALVHVPGQRPCFLGGFPIGNVSKKIIKFEKNWCFEVWLEFWFRPSLVQLGHSITPPSKIAWTPAGKGHTFCSCRISRMRLHNVSIQMLHLLKPVMA